MGQGGYLKLINATSCKWIRTHQHSYQMHSWNLPQILDPGCSERVYVEYNQNIFKVSTDDRAETNYRLDGTNRHFEIQARSSIIINGIKYFKPDLRVDLQNVQWDDPDIQPIPPKSDIVDLGWVHNGEVSFTLLGVPNDFYSLVNTKSSVRFMTKEEIDELTEFIAKKVKVSQKETHNIPVILQQYVNLNPNSTLKQLLEEGALEKLGKKLLYPSKINSDVSMNSNLPKQSNDYWLRRWMFKYRSSLQKLKIEELSIPGTHDSGTYNMVSDVSIPWTKTQNLNILEQLNYGARALDLRIGLQTTKSGDKRFILVHDTWRTHITLKDALKQVVKFSNNEPSEIVILDFHRFVELEHATQADYEELVSIVKETIGNKLIPSSDKNKTLEELWSTEGRIIVAWNRAYGDGAFWNGVNQEWYNKSKKLDLYNSIENEMTKSHSGLWSICAILTPSAFNPIQSLNPDLSIWFASDSDWSKNSNIVSCDFIEKTQLCQNLITASVLKGVNKKTHVVKQLVMHQ